MTFFCVLWFINSKLFIFVKFFDCFLTSRPYFRFRFMEIAELRPNFKGVLVARYQNTEQIAAAIQLAINESAPAANYLSKFFKNPNKIESLRLIYFFTKKTIPYKKEPGSRQTAKTLQRILNDSKTTGGDCKHYSVTIASLCKSLNIPVKLRMVGQSLLNDNLTHIYPVAIINGNEFILDCCVSGFNQECRYTTKKDLNLK